VLELFVILNAYEKACSACQFNTQATQ